MTDAGIWYHDVGAMFIGPQISELLHSATIAVVGQVPIDRLWHAVPSFPTISEIWIQLLENYDLSISQEPLPHSPPIA